MIFRVLLATAVTAASMTAAVAVASPAQAQDRRPCVSKVEYQSAVGASIHTDGKRSTVEARWEVHGYGLADVPGIGTAVVYPRCGYRLREAWIAVAYDKNDVWTAVAYVKDDDATLHGRPRYQAVS